MVFSPIQFCFMLCLTNACAVCNVAPKQRLSQYLTRSSFFPFSLIHLSCPCTLMTIGHILCLTFPQLLTSNGKEQRWKTPRARSSSPQLFTLKALGSSKARAGESRSGCGEAPNLGAAVPIALSNNRRGSGGRKREHIILPRRGACR